MFQKAYKIQKYSTEGHCFEAIFADLLLISFVE